MISRARTVWIRNEWAFVFQTHCPRHRAPLIERCAVCFVEDPLLPNANAFSAIPSCWKCGSALFSYDADERASSIVAEIISLESAILELMTRKVGTPCRRPEQGSCRSLCAQQISPKRRAPRHVRPTLLLAMVSEMGIARPGPVALPLSPAEQLLARRVQTLLN